MQEGRYVTFLQNEDSLSYLVNHIRLPGVFHFSLQYEHFAFFLGFRTNGKQESLSVAIKTELKLNKIQTIL